MKKLISLILTVLAVVTFSSSAMAQSISKYGTSAADFLRIPVGARTTAMGEAGVASVNDATAMFWNPARLANLEGSQVSIEFADMFADISHNYLAASYKPDDKSAVGLNIVALNLGDFEETTYDFTEGTGRTFSANSFSLGVTYARMLMPTLSLGANVKMVRENIMNSSASTIAFDIGTWYETPFYGIKFGVAVTNAGGKMQLDGDDLILKGDKDPDYTGEYQPDTKLATNQYDLPLNLRVGFYWDQLKTENYSLKIAVDGNAPSDNVQYVNVGAEIGLLDDMLTVRGGLPYLGFADEYRVYQATLGFGFNYKLVNGQMLRFGYAWQSHKYLSDVSRFSLSFQF